MMTKRPWPPLYRHPLPMVAAFNEAVPVPVAYRDREQRDHAKVFYENAPRYGMALCKDYVTSNCYFMATPMYRSPVAAIPCLPPVRVPAARRPVFFEPPMQFASSRARPLERVHFSKLQQHSTATAVPKKCSCKCAKNRSRSLENLCPSDANTTTTTTSGDREETYFRRRRKLGKENFKRRSMDNLVEQERQHRKKNTRQDGDGQSSNGNKPRFLSVTTLEDVQAIRCAEFHPQGSLYAVGSNSKTLRICAYPKLHDLRDDHKTCQPTVLFKRTKHHKGSIYCMAWTPIGDLLATGSNDKTVKLMKFNNDTANFEGQEIELAMHDGTVRDVCFLEDTSNKSSLLISGGAGDCKIYVTDCATGQPYQALSGHCGHILSLYNWGGVIFVSGSQDRTVRFWDLRTRGCVNVVTPITSPTTRQGSPTAAVCVDPSGRLLVSGHEDASCVLYDIRGARTLQCFKPHAADVRSIRFSPSAYYLLTAGYDNKLVLTDLQGDLTSALPSVIVAQHQDKVISGRWHPAEFSFLSTSADKTATLWALPPI